MQNASLPKDEKSLASASIKGNSNFAAAATQMRQPSGSWGGANRQDVFVAADANVSSEDENEPAARLVYRRVRKNENFAAKKESEEGKCKNKGTCCGQPSNGSNRRAGERNRCFACNSEYHFAPSRPCRGNRRKGSTPSWKKPPRPPFSSIAVGSPTSAQEDGFPRKRIERATMNSLLLSHWIGVAGFFVRVRTVWSPWKLAPLPIWFVSSGRKIVICYWVNRDYRGYRPIRQARASNLVMGACGRYVSLRMLRSEARGVKAPSRHLRWERMSGHCCLKVLWGPGRLIWFRK